MLTLYNYKTLTKAENTWHRNKVFPGEKNKTKQQQSKILLKVTEQTSSLAWMNSNNFVSLKTEHLLTLTTSYQSDNYLFQH